jgi:sec-independent protein translocase protein TatA
MFSGIFEGWHLVILLVVGVLVFGKNLPSVGRNLGKSLAELKKGLRGIEDDVDNTSTAARQEPAAALQPPPRPPQRVVPTAPKFEDNAGVISNPQNPPSA